MRFFVPAAEPAGQEQAYVALAKSVGRQAPLSVANRIYAISFTNDGEQWRAAVGEAPTGSRTRRLRRKGQLRDVTTPLRDRAVVLAIFSGNPYLVVTTAAPGTSHWENPFMAGIPSSIERFDAT